MGQAKPPPEVQPIVDQPKSYLRLDEHGVYRVGNTQVMYESVLYGFLRAESPEYIRQQFPSLTLEEVYGSIAYYLGHREEIDAYLKRQEAVWEHWRREFEKKPDPLLDRLRALKNAKVTETS